VHLPIDLSAPSSVLVAGAGGGFDIVCCLPVALALRAQGHRVHLGNYSVVLESETVEQVADAIERARERLGVLPRADIPI
jgi:hypothetical protein